MKHRPYATAAISYILLCMIEYILCMIEYIFPTFSHTYHKGYQSCDVILFVFSFYFKSNYFTNAYDSLFEVVERYNQSLLNPSSKMRHKTRIQRCILLSEFTMFSISCFIPCIGLDSNFGSCSICRFEESLQRSRKKS